MSIKDGELPAYPFASDICGHHGGMTLRDYFAARAMQAAATTVVGANGFTFEERARWAYQQADAMLSERDKERARTCNSSAAGRSST
jgi:hypothetical protein